MSLFIRPYQPKDRPFLREIFGETAFHGLPYQNFFPDLEWLADFMTAGYTDEEFANCYVAEENGRVVGYLTGTLDTHKYHRLWRKRVLPLVAKEFFIRGIWKSGQAWRFFYNGLKSALQKEESIPRGLHRDYPAHFHINLREGYRNRGIGKQLAAAFFERMKAHQVRGVHVRTASIEGRQRFFESLGMRVLLKKQLTLWDYLHQPPYYLMTYGLYLAE